MIALGLAASAELETSPDVAALHTLAQTASADLKLAEALMGSPLGPDEPLDANLPHAFAFDASGQAFIARYVSPYQNAANLVTHTAHAHSVIADTTSYASGSVNWHCPTPATCAH